MSNSNRMNQFLQQTSSKSDEEEEEEISPDIQYFERTRLRRTILSRRNNNNNNNSEIGNRSLLLFRKNSLSRKSSCKKFAISSESTATKPIKQQEHQSPMSLTGLIPSQEESLNISSTHDNIPCCKMEPMRKSKTLPASLTNSHNIVENIVQEFESGFMSPRSNFDSGSGNFVKRIVAAFEEKYKPITNINNNNNNNNNNNPTTLISERVRDDKLKDHPQIYRHSFSNICQSLHFAAIEISDSLSSTSSSNEALKFEYRSPMPLKIIPNENENYEKNSLLENNHYIQMESKINHYIEMEQKKIIDKQLDLKIDNYIQRDPKIDHYIQNDNYVQRDPKIDHYDHYNNESKNVNQMESKISNSQIDQYLERKSLHNNDDNNDDSTLKRKERAPIIIGAFLKKPVKVEEISVNWIPFPGKKLPRKKSLKKLLSTLSGKKLDYQKKKEVVFSSQVNVNDENRELPDSGYDEQSSLSSSSLTSITSSEVQLRNQKKNKIEHIYANNSAIGNWSTMPNFNRKSTNLSTFQSIVNYDNDNDNHNFDNGKKKILLYEIPRDEVKVDLGPCYPSPSKIMVKSLDRKFQTKLKNLPKHPMCSRIPKHPFISPSKDEDSMDDDNDDEVILRKPRESSFHSSENEYDVPRKYLSRSEPGISDVIKFSFDLCLDEVNTYDVPKLRPKSSVYEDALSLKRRNADFVSVSGSSQDYYSSPSPPQYATIKSRNKRYLSPEVFRSADELRTVSTKVTSF
ncbi:putative uncharacterized protein DDB_G0291812 [Leptopilina boulardi]|uniref:putative uncharacterized protein DDB_G0291812 n=1 Tax=Leptopilina boulardi TaxID=63433 RepID=UPI0021F68AEA|nr:putative uncharacterized protein DDB_G0291812 [Leptopilina boulardi]